ncbi:MAG: cysteine synthase family protein [Bacteroidia bacterium]
MISSTIYSPQSLLQRLSQVESLTGNTPLYALHSLSSRPDVQIFAKCEWMQLGQSVKARPAFRIIQEAILHGELGPAKRLLDASSGNTAIAYASIGAALGIDVTICLPENASKERKQILKSLGVELILTSPFEGTDGAQTEARRLADEQPDRYYYADQYNNESNWRAHYHGTAQEIFAQTHGKITHFITGLGTTGTFVGTSRGLKDLSPFVKTISVEPETALHGLEGWKHLETVKIPGIYDSSIADEHRSISTGAAYEMVKRLARDEGLLLSPSSAANVAAALALAEELEEAVIVTVLPDDASKYSEVISQLFT